MPDWLMQSGQCRTMANLGILARRLPLFPDCLIGWCSPYYRLQSTDCSTDSIHCPEAEKLLKEPLDSDTIEKLRDHFPDKDWTSPSVLRPVPAPSASGSSEAGHIQAIGSDVERLSPSVQAAAVVKQALGEQLCAALNSEMPNYATKIVGMLLPMENEELQLLLGNKTLLYSKAQEAMTVLMAAGWTPESEQRLDSADWRGRPK